MRRLVLGGVALLFAAQLFPPTTLTWAGLGLAAIVTIVLRRRRHLTLAPI